jgi:3-hydroxyacyl-CoA dehydrogenase
LLGYPLGPVELADFVGLDIGLAVAETALGKLQKPQVAAITDPPKVGRFG